MAKLLRIDLGCGNNKKVGCQGIDIKPLEGVDIVADATKEIPLADNSVEYLYSSHFLEHVESIRFVASEIYRICCNGAIVEIKVPLDLPDPAHKVILSWDWEKLYFDPMLFWIVDQSVKHVHTHSCVGKPFEYDESYVKLQVKKGTKK